MASKISGLNNPFLPPLAKVIEVTQETPTIKTLSLSLMEQAVQEKFSWEPGQMALLTVFGVGESPFAISSNPNEKEYLQFSVQKVGKNTAALHDIGIGSVIGVRGPFGYGFPVQEMQGKNIILIGGGIGLAPLRSLIFHLLEHRKGYGQITLLYGARSPQELCFKDDLALWENVSELKVLLTVDHEAEGWTKSVGYVPALLEQLAPKYLHTVAVTCGPPIMIKKVIEVLSKLGFASNQIITSLERRMKCGIGLCGRCNIGGKFVCKDGPVFDLAEIEQLPLDE